MKLGFSFTTIRHFEIHTPSSKDIEQLQTPSIGKVDTYFVGVSLKKLIYP